MSRIKSLLQRRTSAVIGLDVCIVTTQVPVLITSYNMARVDRVRIIRILITLYAHRRLAGRYHPFHAN